MRTSSTHLLRFRPLTAEVQRAMRLRDVEGVQGRRQLAADVGSRPETIWAIWTGRMIPSPDMTARLAEALHWSRLVKVSEAIRVRACVICEQPFVDSTAEMKRLYCSPGCHRTGTTRQRRGAVKEQITITKRMLARHREAVGAFCRSCTDSGVCPDSSCQLRPISPLPLPRGEQWAELRRRASWLREEAG